MTLFRDKIRRYGMFAVTAASVVPATIVVATLLAGGASFLAITPWLALGLLGPAIAGMWHCSSRRRKNSNVFAQIDKIDAFAESEQHGEFTDEFENELFSKSVGLSSIAKRGKGMSAFFSGVAIGTMTGGVIGGVGAGYATGVITVESMKSAAILFAGSSTLAAAAPWLAVGFLGAAGIAYYCWRRRCSPEIIQPISSATGVLPNGMFHHGTMPEREDEDDSIIMAPFLENLTRGFSAAQNRNSFLKGLVGSFGTASVLSSFSVMNYAAVSEGFKSAGVLFAGSGSLAAAGPWIALAVLLLVPAVGVGAYAMKHSEERRRSSSFGSDL